jgi:amino acid transporter
VVLFAGLAAVQRSRREARVGLVEAMTIAKLLPLVTLVAVGIWFVNPEYVRWPAMPAATAVGETAIVLIFAFVGLEIAPVPSGEVRDRRARCLVRFSRAGLHHRRGTA